MHIAQPLHPRRRQNDAGEVFRFDFLQTCVDIAAQRNDLYVRQDGFDLRAAAKRPGADLRAFGHKLHLDSAARHQYIPYILAFQNSRKLKPFRDFSRHVLHAVDGQIDGAGKKRLFNFLDERALSSDL